MPPRASAQSDPDKQRKLLITAVVLLVAAAVIFAVFFRKVTSDGLTAQQRTDVTTPLQMPMPSQGAKPTVLAPPPDPNAAPMARPTPQ